tara:strand:+ start:1038 stop:1589 length:552 start_codon:yes stop_codon:yes gene_type:complete
MLNLKVELDEGIQEYFIPNGWDEVSIIKYKKLMALQSGDVNNLQLYINIITVLSGMDKDSVEQISATDFEDIVESLKFTQTMIETPLEEKEYLLVEGDKYYLKKDFSQLTLGEQASIEIILKKYDGKLENAISELLCIFLRKKRDNGKLEKFKNSFMGRSEMFNDVMIADVHNIFIFFLTGRN